jgi:HK97 family phage major capsid protein
MKNQNPAVAAAADRLAELRGAERVARVRFEKARAAAMKAGAAALSASSKEFQDLDATGRTLDRVVEDVARAERTMARMASVEFQDEGRAVRAEHPADVDGFKAAFAAWLGENGSEALSNPHVELTAKSLPFIRKANIQNALTTSSTIPAVPWRQPGFEPIANPTLALLGMIQWLPTDSPNVQYMAETLLTSGAVETPEGNASVEAAVIYAPATTAAKNIPMTIPATRQVVSDGPNMEAFLEGRLLFGVQLRLQSQVIAGDGTGENLTGILHSSILTQAKGGDTNGDAVMKAKTAIRIATATHYEPDVLLLHPTDAQTLALAKGTNNQYLFDPAGSDTWGLRPCVTTAVPVGAPVVGAAAACEGYLVDDLLVAMTDSHSDHFTKNILDFIVSGRWAFAVRQPNAFCQVTGF